jgi:hypothetical protein
MAILSAKIVSLQILPGLALDSGVSGSPLCPLAEASDRPRHDRNVDAVCQVQSDTRGILRAVKTGLTEATELLPRLQQVLPEPVARALAAVVDAAEGQRRTLYLVGGCVRDLALGRDLLDVDIVAEGDVQSLAATAASALGGRCVAHGEFGTATLDADAVRVDLAMARAETYARPGALPRVRPASVEEDLARRDFTINALALALCGPKRGRLLDPFRGRDDLRRGLVRVSSAASSTTPPHSPRRALRRPPGLSARGRRVRAAAGRFLSGYHQRGAAAAGAAAPAGEERPRWPSCSASVWTCWRHFTPALRFDRRLAAAFPSGRRGGCS